MLSILWLLAIGSPEGVLAISTDSAQEVLYQAAKEQDPTLRQASAYALANLATDPSILKILHKAVEGPDKDVRDIAFAALKTLEPAPSTSHTDTKYVVLQKFFKQAVAANDVSGLAKLILENLDEVGELCKSLKGDLLMKVLPQTADVLLTWGVTHNRYALVELIIERGKQHITNELGNCLGKRVTKLAAQQGYQKLFLLLIKNNVDVDTHNTTAFMHAIICGQYELADDMLHFGENRLWQLDKGGKTPQDYLNKKQLFRDEKSREQKEVLEAHFRQEIAARNQNDPRRK